MRPLRILVATTAAAACAVLTPYAVAHAQSDEVPVEQTDGNPDEVLETTSLPVPADPDQPPVVDCNMVAPEPVDGGVTEPAEEPAQVDPAPGEDVAPADEPAAPDEPVSTDGDPDEVYCIAASGPGMPEVVADTGGNPAPRPMAPADNERAPVAKPVKARASFTG